MATGQPQSYGSIREFLDNLPNQPCIWQPKNANICVTCLRINEPVARVCSVWAQALEEAPLEEIDFEEEVQAFPSVVEIEDEFEMIEENPQIVEALTPVAEVDIVDTNNDWNMAEEILTENDDSFAIGIEAEPADAVVAEAEPADAVVAEPVVLDTIQDALEAEQITKEKVDEAVEKEEAAADVVAEAAIAEAEAVEAYAEAIKVEEEAAEAVTEASEEESEKIDAVIEASVKVEKLVEEGENEEKIEEALTDLKEKVQEKEEAEVVITEALEAEDTAAVDVVTTSEEEEVTAEELDNAVEVEEKTSEELTEAIETKEKASEEVGKTLEINEKDVESPISDEEPFMEGDKVSHGVYGKGTVKKLVKAGKHWSVKVAFEEGERSILGTFLTLDEVKEDNIDTKEIDPTDYQRPNATTEEENSTEEEPTEIEADNAEPAVVVDDVDYGDYKPGTSVTHEIFGTGNIEESSPKGENYRLEILFEDGTKRTLLSTFVKLADVTETAETVVAEAETADVVVAEAETADAVVAEAETADVVVAEAETADAVVAEAEPVVLDTDVIYQRPKKDKEAIIDLSKPEVQDAEMVDDE